MTACLNLAAARQRYIVGTAWSTKCYMNMRPLYQPQLRQTEAVERFWTLPETGIGRAGQGKRKDDCQLVLDGQNPRGLHSTPTVLASSSQFRAFVALAGRVRAADTGTFGRRGNVGRTQE